MDSKCELHMLCRGNGWGPCFAVSVFRCDGECVYCDCLCPEERDRVVLPEGEYMVRVRNYIGLEPHGFTRWVRLEEGNKALVQMAFRRPVWLSRLISFTVFDANYPGIVPLNGGITVWQNRNM